MSTAKYYVTFKMLRKRGACEAGARRACPTGARVELTEANVRTAMERGASVEFPADTLTDRARYGSEGALINGEIGARAKEIRDALWDLEGDSDNAPRVLELLNECGDLWQQYKKLESAR